ncbi:MAG: SDR family oxidoreductase [Nitrospirales bacterium]|nr:SDR family oxidoreductase [Nitrospira sp.]MDR4501643.1 SDR family oxidoreductase [Nitrospirales bacterium]
MFSFLEKVVLITGASEGIGRALALALAPLRPKLVLIARNEERLQEVASECEQCGAATCVVPADITEEQACRQVIDRAVGAYGGVDVLVNNAGMAMRSTFEETSDLSIFEYLMKLNYLSGVYCTKYALPYLKEAKGQIVAISSVAGLTGVPTRTGYAASKHAMIGFFESLRIELAETGVTVTIVAPDYVQSQIHERSFDAHGHHIGINPANRHTYLTAEACAAMIVKAMEKRQRLLVTSWRGRLGRIVRTILPTVIDGIAKKAVEEEMDRKN